jgi:hypothetical protein
MNSDSSTGDHSIQLPPQELARFFSSLGTVLIENNLTGAMLNDILTNHVSAECVLCGINITGDELGFLSTSDPSQELNNPKLTRIRLGYCGRADCQSRNYSVKLLSHAALDWPEIADKASQPPALTKQPFRSQSQIDSFEQASRPAVPVVSLKLILAAAIILITIIAHLWINGARIPWLQPKHVYTIDPASTGTNSYGK